jgi:hypothetical protein
MKDTGSQSCLAAFRPWPFGPPLRGRAPRGEAGLRVACGLDPSAWRSPGNGPRPRRQATAPAGGLAWTQPLCFV